MKSLDFASCMLICSLEYLMITKASFNTINGVVEFGSIFQTESCTTMVRGNDIMVKGKDTYYIKSIKMYAGSYKAGRRHGKGAEYYLNGVCKYAGDYKDGLYDGYGSWFYESDELEQIIHYEGQWKAGLAHGWGQYHKRTHLDYEGEWFADKRTGQGTMYDEEGIVYSGIWLNDLPHETLKRKNSDDEGVIEAEAYNPTKKRRSTE